MTETAKTTLDSQRLLSLDFLRGFIMVLLMMGSTSVYDYLDEQTVGQSLNLIVGMNSIFIYVFFEIVGGRWFNGYISAISNGVVSWFTNSSMIQFLIAAICIFTLEWLLCYFLYKRKIFFKV